MLHAALVCAKAVPILDLVDAAIKIERWVVQRDEKESTNNGMAYIAGYYGPKKEGGGVSIALDILPEPKKDASSELFVTFHFSVNRHVVAGITFGYDMEKGEWYACHHAILDGEANDPSMPLAKKLGLPFNSQVKQIENQEEAMALIAKAADYAFENCNK